jgi:hypothetical protein
VREVVEEVGMSETAVISRHQWTHGGTEVLIAKCVSQDGRSYGGFQWPLTVGATVEAPDWRDDGECGGGLHGWPWLFSVGDGKDPDYAGTWIVFGAVAEDVRDLGGKVKVRRGVVRCVGSYMQVVRYLHPGQLAWIAHAAMGAATSTGDGGAATSTGYMGAASSTGDWSAASSTGDRGAASSTGDWSAASSTGDRGAASSTGYMGAASSTGARGAASSTGDWGAASSTGDMGAASSTGDGGAAVATGINSRAQAGPYGCVALAWWNTALDRAEMRCLEVGCGDGSDGKGKSGVWYRLDEATGAFVEESAA